MNPEIDPTENREEFEKRINQMLHCLNGYDLKDIILALIVDDQQVLGEIKNLYDSLELRKSNYLTRWDNAASKDDKNQLIASIKR